MSFRKQSAFLPSVFGLSLLCVWQGETSAHNRAAEKWPAHKRRSEQKTRKGRNASEYNRRQPQPDASLPLRDGDVQASKTPNKKDSASSASKNASPQKPGIAERLKGVVIVLDPSSKNAETKENKDKPSTKSPPPTITLERWQMKRRPKSYLRGTERSYKVTKELTEDFRDNQESSFLAQGIKNDSSMKKTIMRASEDIQPKYVFSKQGERFKYIERRVMIVDPKARINWKILLRYDSKGNLKRAQWFDNRANVGLQ